eukprot:TRINITY_DN5621_c0_g1_i1.p1 TRINITY_DN5621_c0_g1~~TRINITY_DN5621_c0_g1_i1.p1  ORF type:complete len:341 (+),score=69.28 TRINITY_DN5621_c0_g1_i1:62-1024(+)
MAAKSFYSTPNAHVIIASRSAEKSQRAIEEIKRDGKSSTSTIEFRELDLGSFKSIQAFTQDLRTSRQKLDVIVNNAGLLSLRDAHKTEDGLEINFGVNYLGPYALTRRLLKNLTKDARVINVASDVNKSKFTAPIATRLELSSSQDFRAAHGINASDKSAARQKFEKAYLSEDQQDGKKKDMDIESYAGSKLGNILFTYELQRRLNNDPRYQEMSTFSYTPGGTSTDIFNDLPAFIRYPLKLFLKSPTVACKPIVNLATSPLDTFIKGGFYDSSTKLLQLDPHLQEKYPPETWKILWDESSRLCRKLGITFDDDLDSFVL